MNYSVKIFYSQWSGSMWCLVLCEERKTEGKDEARHYALGCRPKASGGWQYLWDKIAPTISIFFPLPVSFSLIFFTGCFDIAWFERPLVICDCFRRFVLEGSIVRWNWFFLQTGSWGAVERMELTGRVALVTGGACGIGSTYTEELLNHGAKV